MFCAKVQDYCPDLRQAEFPPHHVHENPGIMVLRKVLWSVTPPAARRIQIWEEAKGLRRGPCEILWREQIDRLGTLPPTLRGAHEAICETLAFVDGI